MPFTDPVGSQPVDHVEVAAVVARLRFDERDALGDLLRRGQEGPPSGGVLRGSPQGGVGIAADPDRKMRLLNGFGFELDIVELASTDAGKIAISGGAADVIVQWTITSAERRARSA